MKLNGAVIVNAPMEKVWNLFMDPTQLCRVIPGCEQARQLDETHYEAVLSVKVQFMTIRSNARGTLLKAEPPQHLVVELMGEPVAMAGAFRAQVSIDLSAIADATNVQVLQQFRKAVNFIRRPHLALSRKEQIHVAR